MNFGNVGATDILNLKKDNILDLTKTGSSLKHLILGAGWDVPAIGPSYDLDIAAFLLHENRRVMNIETEVIYFRQKTQDGIYLEKDNLTGDGDGDDERIHIDMDALNPEITSIVCVVTIYDAEAKKQVFGNVKNAYVRLLDEDNNEQVLCQFPLTTDASTDTAVVFCELFKEKGNWKFKAIGDSYQGNLNTLLSKYM